MATLTTWLRKRVPVSGEVLRELTNEPVPNHLKHWWFCLGGTPAYLFVVQIATGILLAFYYQPAQTTAYDSVRDITEQVNFGWYFRSMHKWAATLMIAAVILHQMRVFFTGAYRKPREINWIIGMFLLVCSLMLGFTGYSLVGENLSLWGATVGANIAENTPLIGGFLKRMMLGGPGHGEHTYSRLFIMHAAVLPVALILLLVIHILLLRLHGVTEFQFARDSAEKPKKFLFFPDHFFTELIIGLALMILLCVLATVMPVTMGPRANPNVTPEIIKPEWYFLVTFRWLKFFPITVAILSMGLIVFAMFCWPFIDGWIRKYTRYQEASVWIGIVVVFVIIGLTVWEALVAH